MALRRGQAPILLCPDILVEILHHLQPGRRSPQENAQTRRNRRVYRKTLLAVSLTCRTLSGLALDVLWRALDDVQPLLRLLHRDKRHGPMIVSTTFAYMLLTTLNPMIVRQVLKSQITPEAWAKLQSYANRVHELAHFSRPDQVHPSVWTFLAIKCEGSPLFPRLYDLEAREIFLNDLSSLFLLLSPSLRSLHLSFKGDSKLSTVSQIAFLALVHITQTAPRITSFHMSGDHHITREHVSILHNFSRLADLSLGPGLTLDGPMLLQLSTSISLDTLTVSIHNIHSTDLQSLDNGFRSLRKLTVRGTLNHLVKFMLSSLLPHLDEIMLQVIDSGSVNQKKLYRGLASICQHSGLPGSLTRVGCEFCSGVARERQDTLVRDLKPFLESFPLVEHCHFTFYDTPPSICDGDLTQLGDTWANLQSLEIRSRHRLNEWYDLQRLGPPADILRPTLSGLAELARRCPSLVRVHLPELDATTLPRMNTVARLGHSVREVSFDNVRYAARSSGKPCAVAAVFDIAFPKLDVSNSMPASASAPRTCSHSCDVSPASMPHAGSEWKKVMKFVHAMQLGRRHLTLNMDSGAASGTEPADLDLDWDLGSEGSGPEPEPESDWDDALLTEESGSEADSDPDPRSDSPAAALFGDSDSDVRVICSFMRHMMDEWFLTMSYLAQRQRCVTRPICGTLPRVHFVWQSSRRSAVHIFTRSRGLRCSRIRPVAAEFSRRE